MASFWLLLLIGLVALYLGRRIDRLEARMDRIERGKETERGNSVPLSATPSPTPTPAPAPAPRPALAITSEAVEIEETTLASSPKESQEERGARWLGRLGALALILGVAFFLQYAFEHDLIGEKGRVILGIVAGMSLLGLGQKLRARYLGYSDLLLASGIGILYLSIYASYGFYHLLAPTVAMGLMSLVTLFSLLLSATDASPSLALIATLGGFATPVLLSTGANELVGLSLYMLVLDIGVFGTAFYKKWVSLNYVSFIGTVVLFGGWMNRFYTESELALTLGFASMFFLVFLATSVTHHIVLKHKSGKGDLALITFTALWYFALAYDLLAPHHHEYLGMLALLLAALYIALSYLSFGSNRDDRTLNLFLPGIAVVFLTVAVPLQLSGKYISLAWLAEAAVLLSIGLYLKERVVEIFAWIVLFLGIGSVIDDVVSLRSGFGGGWAIAQPDAYMVPVGAISPFMNIGFFLMMSTVFALYLFAYLYHRLASDREESGKAMLLSLSLASLGTAAAVSYELTEWGGMKRALIALPWLIEGVVIAWIGMRRSSRALEILGWAFVGFGTLSAFSFANDLASELRYRTDIPLPSPFMNLGFLAMVASVAATYAFTLVYRANKERMPDWKKYAGALLIVANLLTVSAVSMEIGYYYDRGEIAISRSQASSNAERAGYYGGAYVDSGYQDYAAAYSRTRSIQSSKSAAITVFWALYAVLLLVIGFARRIRTVRLLGLALFFITAVRVFFMVWELGQLARIVSALAFGAIALLASFLYVRYKDRVKEMVMEEDR